MIEILSEKGDFFTFDPETELISMNGVIVPYTEYQPVYVRQTIVDGSVPPMFIGVLNKTNNTVINVNGTINKLISDDSEIII